MYKTRMCNNWAANQVICAPVVRGTEHELFAQQQAKALRKKCPRGDRCADVSVGKQCKHTVFSVAESSAAVVEAEGQ